MTKLLRKADLFWKRLEESFKPLDKRNKAAFKNLRHEMWEYAQKVDSAIFLEGIYLIRKAEESEVIENRQAWVMKSIKNRIAEGRGSSDRNAGKNIKKS